MFVGRDSEGSNARSLRNAIVRCGHECLTVGDLHYSLRHSVAGKLCGRGVSETKLALWNDRIVRSAQAWKPDVTIVFRGLEVRASTLEQLRCITVHFHPDDSSSPYNRSRSYDQAESLYDLHVTTKSVNPSELRSRGVKAVLFVRCAYDRDIHVCIGPAVPPRYSFGFIGARRPDRVALIRQLARVWRREMYVVGPKWRRDLVTRAWATVREPQMGLAFAQAVCDAPIQLGLLNSYNRDRHTARSYEIPACGGVLVAERTDEHEEMLEDGSEALFFSGQDELYEKLRWLIARPQIVNRMRVAALARIRVEGNSYEARWREIAATVGGV